MNEKEVNLLLELLSKLKESQICKNGSCIGIQYCEYGINGCYGSECSIECIEKLLQ